MRTCPDIGTLRAALDRALPPGDQAALTAHVDDCPTCRARLADLRHAAGSARDGLALLSAAPGPAATQRAWRRFQARLDHQPRPLTLRERITTMVNRLGSRSARLGLSTALAGLVVALALALTPMGSLAVQSLSIFRVTTFKAITFEVDQNALPRPAAVQPKQGAPATPAQQPGAAPNPAAVRAEVEQELAAAGIALDTTITDKTGREITGATAAEKLAAAKRAAPAGTTIYTPTALPAAVQKGVPQVYVADPSRTTATADLAKLRQALREQAKNAPKGTGMPAIDPNNLPGISPNVSSVSATVRTFFSVVQVWGEGDNALVVAQGPSPELTLSEGIDARVIRDALLAMPGISETTRKQVQQSGDDWTNTLLIPVPAGSIVKDDVRIGGVLGIGGDPALLILDPQGKGGLLLFQRNGTLFAIFSASGGESTVMQAANSLKQA